MASTARVVISARRARSSMLIPILRPILRLHANVPAPEWQDIPFLAVNPTLGPTGGPPRQRLLSLFERGIERDRQSGLAAQEVLPRELLSLAPPLLGELQPLRR